MRELFKVEEFEHVLMFLHRLVALIKFLQTIRAPCCVPDSLQSKLHSWWRCMTSSSGPTRSCTLLRVGRTPSCARGAFRQKHQEDVELFLQSVDLTRGATASSSAWQRRSFDRLRGGELPANPNTIVLARSSSWSRTSSRTVLDGQRRLDWGRRSLRAVAPVGQLLSGAAALAVILDAML